MEVTENVKVLNTSVVTLLRAAKNEMLIVDDYLYHYEDRGLNTFRWVCAKKKPNNCRARLVTTPVVGDPTKHVVVRITGTHNHTCDKVQAEKVKRRQATEIEENCNIMTRSSPRKASFERQYQDFLKSDEEDGGSVPEENNDDIDDYIDEEYEVDGYEESDDYEPKTVKKYVHIKKENKKEHFSFKNVTKFEPNQVYILRTQHNRVLVCVNGFLYRLEGKSKTSATFRWECIRSDMSCKTRIYTERVGDARHSLKQLAGIKIAHDHEPYTPLKLSQLIEKHKITFVDSESTTTPKVRNPATLAPHFALSDPLSASAKKKTVMETESYQSKKFILLPSLKGHKVLCVDKMIYHYDARSPCKRRTYWTCYFRNKKDIKCNARLITEESSDGLRIRKMSGTHNHADHRALIKGRIASMARETNAKQQKSKKITRKCNSTKGFDLSSYDSSTSCNSSLSSETPELPEKLEDMRKRYSTRDEKQADLESPERVDFVDPIQTDFFENEHSDDDHKFTDIQHLNVKTNPSRKRGRKRKAADNSDDIEYEMDISKVSQLRSAKGGTLLCVDGYIYHMKSEATRRNYWICIKNRDYSVKCKSFVTTNCDVSGQLKVIHVTNKHNHPVSENDIKRRLCNELTARGALPKNIFKTGYILNRSLEEVKAECAAALMKNNIKKEWMQNNDSKMKLYGVSDGPPSLAVRMTLKALGIPFELINVDYIAAEHMSETYAEMNPQKEIPVLDDNGLYLSESIAIMQYLCDKYAPDSYIYPKDPTARALVNHRLCFNMGFYYASISMHAMAPIFFDYPRNEMTLKKVKNALDVFETYLKRLGSKYSAASHVTIADFALVSATLCLEGIGFDLTPYPIVKTWYETFKQENPTLWEIGDSGMQEIAAFEQNPPDLSNMNHPFHPVRKSKA